MQSDIAQLTRERDEALEREKATAEVLRVISGSPADLQSALGAIAESAARLLDVSDADIMRLEEDGLRTTFRKGPPTPRNTGIEQPWPLRCCGEESRSEQS